MNRNGYTLLEVILTLGLLSASLVGILYAFVTIDRSGTIALKHSRALLLQESKLHDLSQQKSFSRETEGVFDPPFEQFTWKAKQGAEDGSGFKDVHLTIYWDAHGQPKELDLSTTVRRNHEDGK